MRRQIQGFAHIALADLVWPSRISSFDRVGVQPGQLVSPVREHDAGVRRNLGKRNEIVS